jgi:hypothetical protein
VAEEVVAWQRRPLEALYPVMYLDALVVKVKDGAHVRNKAAHIAVGVDIDGIKHVLGIWVQTSEGAKFWGRGGACQVCCVSKAVALEVAALGAAVPPTSIVCRCSARSRSFLRLGAAS